MKTGVDAKTRFAIWGEACEIAIEFNPAFGGARSQKAAATRLARLIEPLRRAGESRAPLHELKGMAIRWSRLPLKPDEWRADYELLTEFEGRCRGATRNSAA